MIRIAIVDGEKSWLNTMSEYLKRYFDGAKEEYVCDVYFDGIDLVSDNRAIYDVVFLDIDMKLLNGVDAAKKLRETDKNVVIVFVTNLAQYAIKGYEVRAFDFIVKPLSYPAFSLKMKRIVSMASHRKGRKISIKCDGGERTVVLCTGDVLFVEVCDHDIVFHTEDGEYHTYGSLCDYEKYFDGQNFFRCHKSYLINVDYITAITGSDVVLGKHTIPLSRLKKKKLLSVISEYTGGD